MCDALQTTGPSRTVLGRVILAHAATLIEQYRGTGQFHADLRDVAEREAEARASRIRTELPEFHKAVGIILRQSAEALRQHAESKGSPVLCMFRGVHGLPSPTATADAGCDVYPMRPLASWSMTFDDAVPFASSHRGGAVLEALVPAACLAISPGYAEEEVMVFPVALTAGVPRRSLHELEVVDVHVIAGTH